MVFEDLLPAHFPLYSVVLFALVAGVVLRLWLASRHIRHIAQHRAEVPRAFRSAISLDAHQKAADYTATKTRLGMWELLWGSALLLGWTAFGGLHWLNSTLLQWFEPGLTQQIALVIAFGAIGFLLDLPFSLYSTFVVEERFGFNRTTVAQWLKDLVLHTIVGLVLGLPILAVVLWLMSSAGTYWWLWAWAALIAFNLLVLFIYPTFIAPIFNKFQPLEDDTTRQAAQDLMQRSGFQAQGFYVMDGSKRSAHANAYFTGFGKNKRVVFFDTLLEKLNPKQIQAVLAHELGHFKHKHILQRMVVMFTTSLLGFALLGYLNQQSWFYTQLGVKPLVLPLADTATHSVSQFLSHNGGVALILFMLVAPLFTFFLTFLSAQWSRKHEFEADAYAVQQTSGQDLGEALLTLYNDNASTLTPDPLYVRFYYSHPAASERLQRMGYQSA